MLSLRRITSFNFARQASHWIRVWPRLAVRKQSYLFPWDSTWPPSVKSLCSRVMASLVPSLNQHLLPTKYVPIDAQQYIIHSLTLTCSWRSLFTWGLSRSHTSTVKIVALLLNAEDSDDMTAANMTAIIKPTIPVGRMFKTSLQTQQFIISRVLLKLVKKELE